MKRVFPLIISLVTLSLIGIILLQVSWFQQMRALRFAQLTQRTEEAATIVVSELSQNASSAPYLKIPRKKSLGLLPEDMGISILRPTISQHYSAFEIREKLHNAFEDRGLKGIDFEFAITSNSNAYNIEMQSEGYAKEALDEENIKRTIIPLLPEGSGNIDGMVPFEHLILIIPSVKLQVYQSMIWMIIGASLFSIVILTAFGVTVGALIRQKKLSEIKTDFINNMTHEFKTPLATISLAIDAIRNEKVAKSPEKMEYFSGIIKEENKRMNRHVETILQAALLDKQELNLNMKRVSANEIVERISKNYQLQIEDKQGKIELHLDPKIEMIIADENHFTNMLSNLVDNAIKYSKDGLLIKIFTAMHGKNVQIKVQDNGIGMNRETVNRVFEKFYRAHTGNIHNVKGFGLGMSYVKTVVDVHKGKIKVESTLGKGSCFIVEFPKAV